MPHTDRHTPKQAESAHFDLGVDQLASGAEIGEMRDPWSPGPDAEVPRQSGGPHVPEGDMSRLADPDQLPGLTTGW